MPRRRSFHPVLLPLLVLAILAPVSPLDASSESAPLVLILDGSGSMWGQIGGENKIVIARRVLSELVAQRPEGSELGLVAYGHRREGDCEDIETLIPLSSLDRAAVGAAVEGINPKGKTPITAAVEHTFEALGDTGPATVILLSDGLETCGGDPCKAVRLARELGRELILHVVGFDVEGEDLSQLQCMAQAGGGLFLPADDAQSLAEALDTAAALPADLPVGRLAVHAIADGALQDVSISVTHAEDGGQAAMARTYKRAETNPSSIPLADGRYRVRVLAMGLKGDVERHFEIEIVEGSTVERSVDYSTGEISLGVRRNGELGDATYKVYVAGTREQVAAGRTYTKPASNPATVRITAGSYDVAIGSVEIAGKPERTFGGVEVEPGGRSELSHVFESGTLKVGATAGSELADAVVHVIDAQTGKTVAKGRTYADAKTNPKTFELSPGRYRVQGKAVRLEGKPKRESEVVVEADGQHELVLDFSQ